MRGRPKHVDRGTERREFNWMSLAAGLHTRYCTVTWMRHGAHLSAMAIYRDMSGLDLTYVGMAQGEIHGTMHRIGDEQGHSVRSLINREPEKERDSIDAVMTLAVLSLEQSVGRAATGDVEDDQDLHPWQRSGRFDFEERRARKARKVVQA